MQVTLFVKELSNNKRKGALRQVAVDSLEQARYYIQSANCNSDKEAMDARVDLEIALGSITTGPILALINTGVCK